MKVREQALKVPGFLLVGKEEMINRVTQLLVVTLGFFSHASIATLRYFRDIWSSGATTVVRGGSYGLGK